MKDRVLTQVEQATKAAGLAVGTSSPGDGVTRYRFFHQDADDNFSIYASYNKGKGIHTAVGRKAALDFLRGYELGTEHEYVGHYRGDLRARRAHQRRRIRLRQRLTRGADYD